MELKVCPFCGNKHMELHYDGDTCAIFCPNCFAQSGFSDNQKTARAAWNTRAEPEPRALTCSKGEGCKHIESRKFNTYPCTWCVRAMLDQFSPIDEKPRNEGEKV